MERMITNILEYVGHPSDRDIYYGIVVDEDGYVGVVEYNNKNSSVRTFIPCQYENITFNPQFNVFYANTDIDTQEVYPISYDNKEKGVNMDVNVGAMVYNIRETIVNNKNGNTYGIVDDGYGNQGIFMLVGDNMFSLINMDYTNINYLPEQEMFMLEDHNFVSLDELDSIFENR